MLLLSARRAWLTLVCGGRTGTFFILADTSDYDVPAKYLEASTPACPNMTR